MATHSSILAWRIAWTEKSGRLLSMESQRVGHDWATEQQKYTGKKQLVIFSSCSLEEEMATHSSVLAWRTPGMAEPGGLRLWGRTESDTAEVT